MLFIHLNVNFPEFLTEHLIKHIRVWAPKTGLCRLVFDEKIKDFHVGPVLCLAGIMCHICLKLSVCRSALRESSLLKC